MISPSLQHPPTNRLISIASLFAFVGTLLVVVGCKSSPSHYVSPRYIGRVLDEKTHEPIAGVKVKRVVPDYEAGTLDQVKGGEILERTRPVQTKADGTFDVDSQKSVALFRELAWFTVEFSFDHRNYEPFVTNYTPRLATNSPSGEPVIYAGEILMTPKQKEP